jgi:hypothetical protein
MYVFSLPHHGVGGNAMKTSTLNDALPLSAALEPALAKQTQTDAGPFHNSVDVVLPPFVDATEEVGKKPKKRLKSPPNAKSKLEKDLARTNEIAYEKLAAKAIVSATEAKKLFAEAKAIHEEYVAHGEKAEKSFKEKIQEAQPHLLIVNDFFAHKKNGELFDGHATAESWYLKELGCSASYARRCLKPRMPHGLLPPAAQGRVRDGNKKFQDDATEFDIDYDAEELASSSLSTEVLNPREVRVKRIMRFIAEAVRHVKDDEKIGVYLDVSVACENAHDNLVAEEDGSAE